GDFAGRNIDGFQNPLRLLVRRTVLRPAQVLLAGLPRSRFPLGVNAALLERLYVVQAGSGIVRRREPVGSAILRRAYPGPCGARLLVRIFYGTSIRPHAA